MANVNVGAAIGAGLGLIARRPFSVLAWGVPGVALQTASLLMLAPYVLPFYAQLFQSLSAGGAPPAPIAPNAGLMQMQGWAQLLNLGQFAVYAVVYCAIFRAVIRPEQSAFAYLRLGWSELFVAVLTFAAYIALIVGMLVLSIPVLILVALFTHATDGPSAAIFIGLPIYGGLALVALVYLALRFSLAGPMIVADRRFHLFESWTATRGQLGRLFLIGLGMFAIGLVFEILVLAIMVALGAAAVVSSGDPGQLLAAFEKAPMAVAARFWPFLLAFQALLIPVGGCGLAIFAAPWARAYLDLQPDHSEVFT